MQGSSAQLDRSRHTLAKPAFLITIDTEGDNLWSKPRTFATRNAQHLPRFQSLCESHGLKPTYLTDYEMAASPPFQEFGKDILRRGAGEIGMHLHAWNTPPLLPLTSDDLQFQPYLTEYPAGVMREKIKTMTDLLQETFGVKMISHRGGRWDLDETCAQVLVEMGYRVDCSVTPHVSWKDSPGDPNRSGGPDYSDYPEQAYFPDLAQIRRAGNSPLLEIPMTIVAVRRPLVDWLRPLARTSPFLRRTLNYLFPPVHWLRPNGRNRRALLRILGQALTERRAYVQFMLHSSELMPGGSPRFPRPRDVETLYEDIEALFDAARDIFTGATLQQFRETAAPAGG